MWHKIRHNERARLIFAYIIFPVMSSFFNIISSVTMYYIAFPVLQSVSWLDFLGRVMVDFPIGFLLLSEILFLLPPTLIRFVFMSDGLHYGLEMYIYMVVSLLITIILFFLLIKEIVLPGLLNAFPVYLILSHKATGFNNLSKSTRYILIFFTLIILLFYSSFINETIKDGIKLLANDYGINNYKIKKTYTGIWWLFSLFCYILDSHKTDNSTTQTNENDEKQELEAEQSKPEINIDIKHKEPKQQKIIPMPDKVISDDNDDNIVDMLIYVGLAHIGRKVNLENKYSIIAIKDKTSFIERPFLDLLSYKFKNIEQREILKKNFMLFKESSLLIIYNTLLKNDRNLHNRIKAQLKIMLYDGLFFDDKSRTEYYKIFTDKIRNAFSKIKDMSSVLNFAFWSTLATKYPDWITLESVADILNDRCLLNIFNYSYMAIKSEYENYQQRQGT